MSRLARKARRGEDPSRRARTDYPIASLSMPLGPIPVIIVLDKMADLIAESFFEGDRGMGILGFLMLFYVASATSNLCLPRSPFLLRQLMLQPAMDTLLGDDVGDCLAPPDPSHMGAFARCTSTRGAGLAAPATGAAAHQASAVASREGRPVALGRALARLDRMANGTRDRATGFKPATCRSRTTLYLAEPRRRCARTRSGHSYLGLCRRNAMRIACISLATRSADRSRCARRFLRALPITYQLRKGTV
jgi:hypothetical protein